MGISSLDAALSGLRVSQAQIDLISQNISNASTPGYTRKILPQSTQVAAGITVGARAENIIRYVDVRLERDLWTQISATENLTIQESYLSRIEAFHGPPDAEISFAAEISKLRDTFSALSDSPDNGFLQNNVVEQAQDAAEKINDFAALLNQLRNDAQNEIGDTIERINNLLIQIADVNGEINAAINAARSAAALEDVRSIAVNELSELIEIDTFTRGDGVMVIQTNGGTELADLSANVLDFDANVIGSSSYYPDTIDPILVKSSLSDRDNQGFDITSVNLGGKLGGLLQMRDATLPKQIAQLDEVAHKMAMRFEAQGLRLFTDAGGEVPPDTAPSPSATAVPYVGFSEVIRVNQDIVSDPSIIQTGTYGQNISAGSNEVIRRVMDFTFTEIDYQLAEGSIDLDAAGAMDIMQDFLGVRSENTYTSTRNLNDYVSMAALVSAAGDDLAADADSFVITFSDPDFGGSYDIEIDLSAALVSGSGAGQDLLNMINADGDLAGAVTDFGVSVSINSNGQLVMTSRGDITIATAGGDPISDTGFTWLGIVPDTYEATDPYFDIQVGNNNPVRITLDPTDTKATLLTKLQAVEGLGVEDYTASADGYLRMRPGNDYDNPDFGGDLKITSGNFTASSADANTVIGAGTIADGVNLVSALFGSFDAGPPVSDASPISVVEYGSETDATATPPIPTTSFRTYYLGPNADISIGIAGAETLLDFSQKVINQQTYELFAVQERVADEGALQEVLNSQLLNDSGVNLDEELGNLIVVQTAYAASARVISAIEEIFDELLNAL